MGSVLRKLPERRCTLLSLLDALPALYFDRGVGILINEA